MTLRNSSLTLVAILAALGCAGTGEGGGSLLISEQQEIEIGGEVHAGIIADYPIYDNTQVTDYVTKVGMEIVPHSGRPNLTHRFYVLNTDVINAFAAPGGYIYVTIGLLREMESRAELAGVLGHEIGHVSARHGVKAMEKEIGLSLLLDMLFGSESATSQVVSQATALYFNTAHSRDQELESDELGTQYAYAAGYNPWGLVDFFEFLKQATQGSDPLSNSISKFLSSHPDHDDRISQTSTQIQALGVEKNDGKLVYDDGNGGYMTYDQLKQLLPAASKPGG